MFYARNGGPSAVAPYAADATNKHMWEHEQQRHQRKLAAVAKSTSAVDQKEPVAHVDTSLLRGRERSKAYVELLNLRQVDQANRKLMNALGDISKKQSITLKRVESEPWVLPPLSCASNKAAARRRKQTALAKENEQLVKRLLAVRTTFDRKADEKNFLRHQRAVQDIRKVPPPAPVAAREKKKTLRLPKLPSVEGGETGDPSVVEASASHHELAHARSLPTLPSQKPKKKRVHIVEARGGLTQGSQARSEGADGSTIVECHQWSPNTSRTNFFSLGDNNEAVPQGDSAVQHIGPLVPGDSQVDVPPNTEANSSCQSFRSFLNDPGLARALHYEEMVRSPTRPRSECSLKSCQGPFEVHSLDSPLSQSMFTDALEEVVGEMMFARASEMSIDNTSLDETWGIHTVQSFHGDANDEGRRFSAHEDELEVGASDQQNVSIGQEIGAL